MYQSVIRDPGGGGLVRIVPNVCGSRTAIVNGSILLVPAGTVAFVEVNGTLSDPYGPGQYQLFTGVDPFFVRLRNIMTHGDSGITVSVFFLSTQKENFFQLGTGEIPFRERRFQLTMNALASCSLTFTIVDPRSLLKKMIGAYVSAFSGEDLEPCLEQLVLAPIREILSWELSVWDIAQFNSGLTAISQKVRRPLAGLLNRYGLRLIRFSVTGIHVPPDEMERLHQLEKSSAEGKVQIDVEEEMLRRIWNGDVGRRTLAEMLTGISSRGGNQVSGNAPRGGMNDMVSVLALSQLFPSLQQPLTSLVQHTDLFGSTQTPPNQDTASADSPPPMPGRTKRCPHCNSRIPRNAANCSVCGHPFSKKKEG